MDSGTILVHTPGTVSKTESSSPESGLLHVKDVQGCYGCDDQTLGRNLRHTALVETTEPSVRGTRVNGTSGTGGGVR